MNTQQMKVLSQEAGFTEAARYYTFGVTALKSSRVRMPTVYFSKTGTSRSLGTDQKIVSCQPGS